MRCCYQPLGALTVPTPSLTILTWFSDVKLTKHAWTCCEMFCPAITGQIRTIRLAVYYKPNEMYFCASKVVDSQHRTQRLCFDYCCVESLKLLAFLTFKQSLTCNCWELIDHMHSCRICKSSRLCILSGNRSHLKENGSGSAAVSLWLSHTGALWKLLPIPSFERLIAWLKYVQSWKKIQNASLLIQDTL